MILWRWPYLANGEHAKLILILQDLLNNNNIVEHTLNKIKDNKLKK